MQGDTPCPPRRRLRVLNDIDVLSNVRHSERSAYFICHCEEATFFVADVAIRWKATLLARALPRDPHVTIKTIVPRDDTFFY